MYMYLHIRIYYSTNVLKYNSAAYCLSHNNIEYTIYTILQYTYYITSVLYKFCIGTSIPT